MAYVQLAEFGGKSLMHSEESTHPYRVITAGGMKLNYKKLDDALRDHSALVSAYLRSQSAPKVIDQQESPEEEVASPQDPYDGDEPEDGEGDDQ